MQARRRLGERGSMTEYALIAIVVGITALFVLGRFGRTLGNRYSSASQGVETARLGERVTSDAADTSLQQPKIGKGEQQLHQTSGREEGGGPRQIGVGAVQFDLSTVIWLALAILVVATLMAVRIFKAAKKEEEE